MKHINRVYRNIELSLRSFIARKLSNAFITINSNIELIWNILRNMKLVHKYVHFLGNTINYNGEILKKNDNMEITQLESKNQLKLFATVNRCKITKKDVIKQCIIELLFQKDNH